MAGPAPLPLSAIADSDDDADTPAGEPHPTWQGAGRFKVKTNLRLPGTCKGQVGLPIDTRPGLHPPAHLGLKRFPLVLEGCSHLDRPCTLTQPGKGAGDLGVGNITGHRQATSGA